MAHNKIIHRVTLHLEQLKVDAVNRRPRRRLPVVLPWAQFESEAPISQPNSSLVSTATFQQQLFSAETAGSPTFSNLSPSTGELLVIGLFLVSVSYLPRWCFIARFGNPLSIGSNHFYSRFSSFKRWFWNLTLDTRRASWTIPRFEKMKGIKQWQFHSITVFSWP